MILIILLWQLAITALLAAVIMRLRGAENETIVFSLLLRRGDRDKLCELLRAKGMTVVSNTKHSDYIRCHTTKTRFELVFNCKLNWRDMLVGGWEVKGGDIPEDFGEVKECTLHKNLMLPPKFLTNTIITR